MTRDPRVRLADILASIDHIRDYTRGISFADFEADSLVHDAVLRRLEIIGEAVKGLPEPDRAKEPEIPWRQIAGTRDKLIHDYYLVDLELVWEMVANHLDPLHGAVEAILRGYSPGEADAS